MTIGGGARAPRLAALPTQRVVWGLAVSNLANELNPTYALPGQLGQLTEVLRHRQLGVELQFEVLGTVALPKLAQLRFLGVHQPTKDIDLADEQKQLVSFDRICQAMRFAHACGAHYMAVHLKTRDVWADLAARRGRIDKSKRWFEKLVEIYQRESYGFWLLVENLEYPKYPATREEIQEMVEYVRLLRLTKEVQKVGFALDVAHLWRSGFLIAENSGNQAVAADSDEWTKGEIAFDIYLEDTLKAAKDILELVHITGGRGQETHLLPGAAGYGQSIDVAREYAVDEINVVKAIEVIYRVAMLRRRPLFVVNEAFGYPYEQMIANCERLAQLDGKAYGTGTDSTGTHYCT